MKYLSPMHFAAVQKNRETTVLIAFTSLVQVHTLLQPVPWLAG